MRILKQQFILYMYKRIIHSQQKKINSHWLPNKGLVYSPFAHNVSEYTLCGNNGPIIYNFVKYLFILKSVLIHINF